MRILKYFKVTIGLQKTNCLSEDLLMFEKRMFKYVISYIGASFKFFFLNLLALPETLLILGKFFSFFSLPSDCS